MSSWCIYESCFTPSSVTYTRRLCPGYMNIISVSTNTENTEIKCEFESRLWEFYSLGTMSKSFAWKCLSLDVVGCRVGITALHKCRGDYFYTFLGKRLLISGNVISASRFLMFICHFVLLSLSFSLSVCLALLLLSLLLSLSLSTPSLFLSLSLLLLFLSFSLFLSLYLYLSLYLSPYSFSSSPSTRLSFYLSRYVCLFDTLTSLLSLPLPICSPITLSLSMAMSLLTWHSSSHSVSSSVPLHVSLPMLFCPILCCRKHCPSDILSATSATDNNFFSISPAFTWPSPPSQGRRVVAPNASEARRRTNQGKEEERREWRKEERERGKQEVPSSTINRQRPSIIDDQNRFVTLATPFNRLRHI